MSCKVCVCIAQCSACAEMATKTSHSGSKQQRQQQLSHHSHRAKQDDDSEDDEQLEKSQDSIESPTSPRSLSRDDVLVALGYRSGNLPQPSSTHPSQTQRRNACRRCGKKVYPLELIDIGDCYHRGCFKCYVSDSGITPLHEQPGLKFL